MNKKQDLKHASAGDIDDIRGLIFISKTKFHKDQAKLLFTEKIKILIDLQKLAQNIKHTDQFVWKI